MGPDYHINVNYNLTWIFTVDSGFYYLARLHFCETIPLVRLVNQRVFSIYINNQTAERYADVISWSGGTGIPVFRDYAALVPDPYGTRSKQDLWLALHPDMDSGSQYGDAILNGLEIFKLNRSDGSFSVPNPDPRVGPMSPQPYSKQPVKEKSKGPSRLKVAVTGVVLAGGVLVLLCLLYFLIHRRKPKEKSPKTKVTSLPEELYRKFTLAEIRTATNNFDEALVISNGGFGRVYKGYIESGRTLVAIKRLKPKSLQGADEFLTEIEMLSTLRHRHSVSLIGYCNDKRQMILVYDYMAHGTLRDHLYKTDNPPLPWKLRLEICIGAARGIEYLHAGAKHTIIHRDVKTTNILVDKN
ncbi:hypothetical protein L1049_002488 [Liquidambar formosana]|uniref:non-specific serine/threonine protein kinase n=1 Tax=Liquidambar formosana TaxID=63359 RepID=A0AAP0NFR4_LIQFO